MRRQNSNNNNNQEAKAAEDDDVTSSKNQRRLLELYSELCKFHDVMMVCSVSDREKLLGHARSISTLFLSEAAGLPEHVAHIALGGMEKVQSVRFALRDEDEFFEATPVAVAMDSTASEPRWSRFFPHKKLTCHSYYPTTARG